MINAISAIISIIERALKYVDAYVRKKKESIRQSESDRLNDDPAGWLQDHFAKTDKASDKDGTDR